MPKLSPALDQNPPQAPEAEQAALGCCLVDRPGGEAVREVREVVAAGDFYRGGHRHIFEAICRVADAGQEPDLITVAMELERAGLLDQAGGRAYLIACSDMVAAVSRAPVYARAVRRAAGLRELIDFGGKLIGAAYEQQLAPEAIFTRLRTVLPQMEGRFVSNGALPDNALPPMYTAPDVSTMELGVPRWAVEGIFPEGLTLFVGRSKIGKSWAAFQTAIAVAAGGRAFAKVPVDQGDVLYLALEDNLRRLKSRLRLLLGDEPPPPRLQFATEWPDLASGGKELLGEWLRRRPDARLIIVDTLARMRGTPDPRGQAYYQDTAAIAALKSLGDQHGVSVMVVHHTRKQAAEDRFDTISGTQGLMAAADATVMLERVRGSADAKLAITGRDVEDVELALQWEGHCAWTLMGDAAEFAKSREQSDTLALFTAARPFWKSREVAQELEIKEGTARQRLNRLADKGLLVSRDGLWGLAKGQGAENTGNGCNAVTDPLFDPFLSTNGTAESVTGEPPGPVTL
jgi:hypothetical protein